MKDETWLKRMIAGTVAHNDRVKDYLQTALNCLPAARLEELILEAERHDFSNLQPELLSACVRVAVSDELIRRFEGIRDGAMTPADAMTPQGCHAD